MPYRFGACILGLLICSGAAAQQPPTSLPAPGPMPNSSLQTIDRLELGEKYQPADQLKYLQAHALIEQYFAEPSRRQESVAALEATGLAPEVIGRLTRVRMDWAALSGGVYYINERIGPHDVRYFLGIPKTYDRTSPWPLVIKLPTADAFVVEPRPDPVQVSEIYTAWMLDELNRHPDAIVIMPLLNLDELWGPSAAGMNSVIQPMLDAANRANIDPARVYLVGHAMSAHAVWNLALHYTTYFAGFEALAGGASAEWQRLRSMNLRNLTPIAWHDANDEMIKVDVARSLVKVLRDQKVKVDYTETTGVGHVPTGKIVEDLYAKMGAARRDLYPESVAIQSNRTETMFNRNDWVQIYQPLNAGSEQRLLITHGSGVMILNSAACSVEAAIDNNTITLASRNVGSMRLYLNDQMVDMDRQVKVVHNRRVWFDDRVRPSIDAMLRDQLFLGRGWRYYTGVIDLESAPSGTAPRPATRPAAATTTRPANSPRRGIYVGPQPD
jgi:hypothetical protein